MPQTEYHKENNIDFFIIENLNLKSLFVEMKIRYQKLLLLRIKKKK